MVVGPKKTLFMDEISTGLDSITTFQIVKCMRNFVHLLEGTVLMALLQPAPETFELFDDILLLAEGHVVFLGPREKIFNFFEGLGFKLPPRKGIADFLQEVSISFSCSRLSASTSLTSHLANISSTLVERDDDQALDGIWFMSSNVLCGHSNV
jgi:ABC-type multidrug transport system ATPase subunit